MKTYTYTIHLEPAEEGGCCVTVPAIPPIVTQGETYEQALAMAKDAVRLYLEFLVSQGRSIPLEESPARSLDLPVQIQLAGAA